MERRVDELLERMLQAGLLELDAGRVRLSLLGRACGQSPFQLDSALQLIETLRLFTPQEATPIAIMALVQGLPEMDGDYTPIARGRGEPGRQAEVSVRLSPKIAGALQRRAADARGYHARCKRVLVLLDWLDGVPMEEIERRYTVNPFMRLAHGDIVGYADSTRFYVQAAFNLAGILYGGQGPTEEQISAFMRQLELGLPADALDLLSLPLALARGEYLALRSAGLTTCQAVGDASEDQLVDILGRRRATELRARLPTLRRE